ncbi:MAG: hypothetical protein GY937_10090 [bacterium]|nr:hypothetical protein [bacterium]
MSRPRRKAGIRKQADQGKISERLLEFAEPMIDALIEETGDPTEEEFQNLLGICALIWNSQVMEQIGKGSFYVEEAKKVLSSVPGPSNIDSLVEVMLRRKAENFSEDLRHIGHFEVVTDRATGELRVRAEARLEDMLADEH